MSSGIYWILNKITFKRYIGSAVNFNKRWNTHKCDLRSGRHHSGHLQNSWNKYGEENFIFEILQVWEDLDKLLKIEQIYLDLYKTCDDRFGYNICPIAGNSSGRIVSKETREKISVAGKGRKFSKEHREKISEANRNRQCLDETKKKISDAHKGKPLSDEHKRKLSEATKGRPISEEARKNRAGVQKKGKDNPNFGKHASEETRQKMSEKQRGENHPNFGKHLSEETKKRISDSKSGEKHNNFGKHLSEETKKKISDSNVGKHHQTDETKHKISKANTGRKHSEEEKRKMSDAQKKVQAEKKALKLGDPNV
jgi:group I intron endonuclease